MHKLNLRKPLAFFDLETTGVNIVRDRIIEISILKALMNGTTEVKTLRINPEMPIPLESSLIHGIYDEDVKDAPTFKSVARNIAAFLEGCDLAGFNSNRFDVPLLVEEFLRAGVDIEMKSRKLVDVQRIFHLMEPRNLSAAYKFYCGKELIDAHSAEADTIATYEILNAQVERYEGVKIKGEGGELIEPVVNDINKLHALTATRMVDYAGRMVYDGKGSVVFNFGKHSGKKVLDVLQSEPSYFEWMMKGDFPLDTKRKLTEIRLQSLKQQ
ncbi:MAG: DNA polymerase III subunit epsilon [Cytophagaceae bacterium SCN 52-12]|nr:MAG: DNA polymerase III subunit epsilon [Cytophagaceae bacterium SCN 52-12]